MKSYYATSFDIIDFDALVKNTVTIWKYYFAHKILGRLKPWDVIVFSNAPEKHWFIFTRIEWWKIYFDTNLYPYGNEYGFQLKDTEMVKVIGFDGRSVDERMDDVHAQMDAAKTQ